MDTTCAQHRMQPLGMWFRVSLAAASFPFPTILTMLGHGCNGSTLHLAMVLSSPPLTSVILAIHDSSHVTNPIALVAGSLLMA